MYDMLKKKNMQKKKKKAKRSKMLLNMIASVYSRRCESYRMYPSNVIVPIKQL